jgi:hypothetical protein
MTQPRRFPPLTARAGSRHAAFSLDSSTAENVQFSSTRPANRPALSRRPGGNRIQAAALSR